jgi:hypothetical protein
MLSDGVTSTGDCVGLATMGDGVDPETTGMQPAMNTAAMKR